MRHPQGRGKDTPSGRRAGAALTLLFVLLVAAATVTPSRGGGGVATPEQPPDAGGADGSGGEALDEALEGALEEEAGAVFDVGTLLYDQRLREVRATQRDLSPDDVASLLAFRGSGAEDIRIEDAVAVDHRSASVGTMAYEGDYDEDAVNALAIGLGEAGALTGLVEAGAALRSSVSEAATYRADEDWAREESLALLALHHGTGAPLDWRAAATDATVTGASTVANAWASQLEPEEIDLAVALGASGG